jgi:hypothetical protein
VTSLAQTLLAELGSDGEGFVLAGPRGGAIDRLDLVMRATCAHLGIDDKVTPQTLSVECGCSFEFKRALLERSGSRRRWMTAAPLQKPPDAESGNRVGVDDGHAQHRGA